MKDEIISKSTAIMAVISATDITNTISATMAIISAGISIIYTVVKLIQRLRDKTIQDKLSVLKDTEREVKEIERQIEQLINRKET